MWNGATVRLFATRTRWEVTLFSAFSVGLKPEFLLDEMEVGLENNQLGEDDVVA